jgi:hypothetical protein
MRGCKTWQCDLFDDDPPAVAPTLPPAVREEAQQVLTQWLCDLSKAAALEGDDEQDRR